MAISERSVYSALKTLEEWGIITVEGQGRKADGSFRSLIYTLVNKNCWKPKPVVTREQDVPSANSTVGKKRQSPSATGAYHRRQLVPNKDTHIEGYTLKDTHKGATPQVETTLVVAPEATKGEYGKPEINWLMSEFEKIMGFKSAGGTIDGKDGRKINSDRALSTHIIKNFTQEQLTYMITYCSTDSFAPRIGSVSDLWHKRGKILAGIKSTINKESSSSKFGIGTDFKAQYENNK